jgi:hypothetical protein
MSANVRADTTYNQPSALVTTAGSKPKKWVMPYRVNAMPTLISANKKYGRRWRQLVLRVIAFEIRDENLGDSNGNHLGWLWRLGPAARDMATMRFETLL